MLTIRRTGADRKEMARNVLVGVLVVYSVAHFFYSGVLLANSRFLGGDFLSAFPGPLMFRATQRWPSLARDWIVPAVVWNYGPVLHLVTFPFILAQTKTQALHIIWMMDFVLLSATFAMWMKLLFPDHRRPLAYLILACIWLNYFPLLEAIVGRESEILELFLVTWGVVAMQSRREVMAGLSFGVAAMIKFLPLIFLPYLLIKRYYRAFWTSAITVIAFAGVAQWLLGFEHSVTFMILSDHVHGRLVEAPYANQALSDVLYKMFTVFNMYQPHPNTLYPSVLRPLGRAIQMMVLAAVGRFLLRWRSCQFLELECALLLVVMVLVAPHAHTYYFVFALPALSVGFAYWMHHPKGIPRVVKVLLTVALVLSGFLVPMKVFEFVTGLPGVIVARVLQMYSLPAFGGVFAVLAMVELHRIVRSQPPPLKAVPVTQAGIALAG